MTILAAVSAIRIWDLLRTGFELTHDRAGQCGFWADFEHFGRFERRNLGGKEKYKKYLKNILTVCRYRNKL